MVQSLVRSRQAKGFGINVREWTSTVYFADASTPRYTMGITAGFTNFRSLAPVPVPDGAQADPSADGHLVVIDTATNCEYDFWQARRAGAGWSASFGNTTFANGEGVIPGGQGARGSGFAAAAGLIRPDELRAGRITHALLMSFPYTKARVRVAPATKTDGTTTTVDAIPMGSRIQLDPTLDLDTLGLTPYEKTVARAMQEYGMYVGDTGGAMSVYAVHPASFASDPYVGVLPSDSRVSLANIPVARMRVLDSGPEMPNNYFWTPTGCAAFGLTPP